MTSSASQQASRGVPPPLDSPHSAPPGGRSRARSQRPPGRHCAPLAGLALRVRSPGAPAPPVAPSAPPHRVGLVSGRPTRRPLGRSGAPARPQGGLALRRPISRLPTRNTGSCALARSLALRASRAAPFGAPVTTLRTRRAGLPTRATARVWGDKSPQPPQKTKPQVGVSHWHMAHGTHRGVAVVVGHPPLATFAPRFLSHATKPQVDGITTRVQGRSEPYGHVSAGQPRVQGSGFGTPRGGGRRKTPPRNDPRFRHPPIFRPRALSHLIKRAGQGKGGPGVPGPPFLSAFLVSDRLRQVRSRRLGAKDAPPAASCLDAATRPGPSVGPPCGHPRWPQPPTTGRACRRSPRHEPS